MEQHERERIQTARKETDTEDSGVVSDGPNLSNTTLTNVYNNVHAWRAFYIESILLCYRTHPVSTLQL